MTFLHNLLFTNLPSWVPMAAGAVGVLLGGLIPWRRR